MAPCPGSLIMLPSSGLMTMASPLKFSGLYLSSLALAEQEESVVRCPQHPWCLGYWYCRGGESHQAELLTNILQQSQHIVVNNGPSHCTGSSCIRETMLMIILEWKSWIRIRILRLETEPCPNYHRSVTKFWTSTANLK